MSFKRCGRKTKTTLIKSQRYTAKAKDWIIVHIESFETKTEALKREKQIKNWKSKLMIDKLIASQLS